MKLGVIGYGNRIRGVINHIRKQDPSSKIAAVVDVSKRTIREQLPELDEARWFDSADDMLNDMKLDGVLIGTRCSLHTEMALKILPTGLPLFLEKPVTTTFEDYERLREGFSRSSSQVVVSFPLRVTSMVKLVKEIIDAGTIGSVEHVQAINNVPYGRVYYQNWYRDEKETGGLFLQKATHDFDYINYVLQNQPTSIAAMTSKQIFKGTKPAGLKCVDCDEKTTCLESTAGRTDLPAAWEYCCYAEDTGNEDSGSALIRYETGMHVSYSQNFFVQGSAVGLRGARFLGYKGTVDFDFMKKQVQIFKHHDSTHEIREIAPGEGHFGGDVILAKNFIEIMRGEAESISSLDAGLLSALMCLKAKKSSEQGTFETIDWNPVRS